MANYHESVYAWVSRIPTGRVATYGQIATLTGCTPRQVGFALSQLTTDSNVPWHRIINRAGQVSCRADGRPSSRQRDRLALESIQINLAGRIDLGRYAFLPLDRQSLLDVARIGLPEECPEMLQKAGI